jgi:hypothetical protein
LGVYVSLATFAMLIDPWFGFFEYCYRRLIALAINFGTLAINLWVS